MAPCASALLTARACACASVWKSKETQQQIVLSVGLCFPCFPAFLLPLRLKNQRHEVSQLQLQRARLATNHPLSLSLSLCLRLCPRVCLRPCLRVCLPPCLSRCL